MSAVFRRAASNASRTRLFSSSATARKDLVQDLYLKEIKAYKPAPVPQNAHVGLVKQYSPPPAPKAPTLPSDISVELSEYSSSEPAGIAPTTTSSASAHAFGGEDNAGNVSGADAYLGFLEQDLPKREEHHH
ncbi:hypothetical protein E1B28_013647 [Marasmius oreades]|uniref:ATP synthase complex subunit H-domain-containing protein n=1 Tax=Marasmius oreades TaxID=181124 RepID=A0A9P7RR02_9AGAR|nr:uncharacterized protein E1B28_013647 [Marasmius oreades]KAG7087700.1 hypothetical protein E1B28_013647 [Marasmius oreades]